MLECWTDVESVGLRYKKRRKKKTFEKVLRLLHPHPSHLFLGVAPFLWDVYWNSAARTTDV